MIQVNRIYLIFNRLVTKKFLVDTSDRLCLNRRLPQRFVPRIGISLPVFPSWVGKAIQSYILYKAVSGKSI